MQRCSVAQSLASSIASPTSESEFDGPFVANLASANPPALESMEGPRGGNSSNARVRIVILDYRARNNDQEELVPDMDLEEGGDVDLHEAFTEPGRAATTDLAGFLDATDRLPGMDAIRAALRRRTVLRPGAVLLDVGCGTGLETARLAADHPEATVIGLDQDAALLAVARSRGAADNLSWRQGDVRTIDVAPGSIDVVRTERVLIYVDTLDDALRAIAQVLRPGGTFASFELDYGGTMLEPAGLAPAVLRTVTACLEEALPQPWAGRRLPGLVGSHGMDLVAAEPYSFAVDRTVWLRIVDAALRVAVREGRLVEPGLDAWLSELADPAFPGFRAVFTGVLTAAQRS